MQYLLFLDLLNQISLKVLYAKNTNLCLCMELNIVFYIKARKNIITIIQKQFMSLILFLL